MVVGMLCLAVPATMVIKWLMSCAAPQLGSTLRLIYHARPLVVNVVILRMTGRVIPGMVARRAQRTARSQELFDYLAMVASGTRTGPSI